MRQGLGKVVLRVIGSLFLACVVSIGFGLITFPVLQTAGGLPIDEMANIGGANMWKIVIVYGLLTAIAVIISLWKKKFRLTSTILVIFWVIGTIITGIVNFSDRKSDQSTFNNNCNEQMTLNLAKACTILVESDQGFGSGFSIKPGFLITNRHVVEGAKKLYTWIDGQQAPLTLWGYSNDADLAVLKLEKEIPQCALADSSQIDLAGNLYAVGWPNADEGESSITKGIYSRTLKTQEGPEFVQTDAAINPGNSGGPLLSKCGVVGVNTVKLAWSDESTPSEGFGFALSSNYIKPLIEFLVNSGSPKQLPVKKVVPKIYTPDYSSNVQTQSQPTPTPYFDLRTEQGAKAYQNYLKDHFAQEVSDSIDSYTNSISGPSISSTSALGGGRVQITWNAVPRASKYDVFYGFAAGSHNFMTSVGVATTAEIGGLPVGNRVFFVVQAEINDCPEGKYNNYCYSQKGNETSIVVK